ncbi:hypothetical protein A7T37_10505 [Salmonella enterica subsp. diarizonae serovar 60:r:e,n,x,z15]|uniref:hypothetical protein n=1 Tax=Salmonella enterica TaxID=28901 RepID=UPI0008A30C70|nr:hypothetical protein [Salmonella enterica]EAW1163184.1 hypothetical protein [Salmonella enterica subsp. enterica]EAY1187906.1 hypothetical protein [Salmonella enterica]MID24178.1 hypothetical protein [Salmonella enterica]OHG05778.1 hypothetical protein A7T37_10505 [Salmonella enterica subsp. diarizonae serovar 60:r:e,n,x,z15]
MKNNNISYRAEIIEKENTDFIFLYGCAGGVNELIHTQPMTPECEEQLDNRLSQLPREADFAVFSAMQKRRDQIVAITKVAEEIRRNR